MRLSLLILAGAGVSLAAGAALAQDDRYDPPQQQVAAAALRGAQPRYLSWPGKTQVSLRGPVGAVGDMPMRGPLSAAGWPGVAAQPAPASARYASLQGVGYGQRLPAQPSESPPRYAQPQPSPAAPSYAPPVPAQDAYVPTPADAPGPQASPPQEPAYAGQPQRLPTSIYDGVQTNTPAAAYAQPAPSPASPAAASYAYRGAQRADPAPLERLPPSPAPSQAVAPPPAPPQAQSAQSEQAPHYYSLHREYGLTPDPVPPPTASVLALSPAVGLAMQANKDDFQSVDLAGQDQALADQPPRNLTKTTGQTAASNAANQPPPATASGSSNSSGS